MALLAGGTTGGDMKFGPIVTALAPAEKQAQYNVVSMDDNRACEGRFILDPWRKDKGLESTIM